MKLIVGLGNPGKKYENTRHNIGFNIVDNYVGNIKWQNKFNSLYTKINVLGEEVIFIKPETFMNLSGDSVVKYVNYFDININDILVIQDDLDMLIGTYKLKKDSSSGGHNGIKSIENVLKSKNFARLKVGILDADKKDVVDFVLGRFSKEDLEKIFSVDYDKIINLFIKEGFEKAINTYKS